MQPMSPTVVPILFLLMAPAKLLLLPVTVQAVEVQAALFLWMFREAIPTQLLFLPKAEKAETIITILVTEREAVAGVGWFGFLPVQEAYLLTLPPMLRVGQTEYRLHLLLTAVILTGAQQPAAQVVCLQDLHREQRFS